MPWTWTPSTWLATTGAVCWPGSSPRGTPTASAPSAWSRPRIRSPSGTPWPDGSGSGLATLLAETGLDDEDARVYLITLTEPGALTAALNWYRAMDGSQLDGLEPVLVPTLYVWSTDDYAVGRSAAERSAAHVWGRYHFEILKNVSHWIPETAPAELSELLIRHLSSV